MNADSTLLDDLRQLALRFAGTSLASDKSVAGIISRALAALDAAEQQHEADLSLYELLSRDRVAAEAQVTALREALNAHRECNRTSSFDLRVLADTAAASERHDAQVIAAERARLRERLSPWQPSEAA